LTQLIVDDAVHNINIKSAPSQLPPASETPSQGSLSSPTTNTSKRKVNDVDAPDTVTKIDLSSSIDSYSMQQNRISSNSSTDSRDAAMVITLLKSLQPTVDGQQRLLSLASRKCGGTVSTDKNDMNVWELGISELAAISAKCGRPTKDNDAVKTMIRRSVFWEW